ncbi:MAG: hypothetical protein JNL21_22730 [Myxococcales bacterium]|nr:hypothetical protein [Myxococcales bacterium]
MVTIRKLLFAVAVVLACSPARSEAQPRKETRGQVLFREGKEAMARGELDVACSKFQQSYDDEKALGPLLNQADCEEKRGRRADALGLWQLAVIATQPGTDERKFAEGRVAELTALLPTLSIRWSGQLAEAAEVTVDGKPFAADGQRRPIDPGTHSIVARTAGGHVVTESVTLEPKAARDIVLEAPRAGEPSSPAPSGASRPPQPPPAEPSGAWIAGWVVGGVGALSLVGFGVTGGLILGKSSEWKDAGCDEDTTLGDCESIKPGMGLWVANGVTLGAGIAGLGVGIILVATQWPGASTPDEPGAATVSIGPGPGDAGLAVGARF